MKCSETFSKLKGQRLVRPWLAGLPPPVELFDLLPRLPVEAMHGSCHPWEQIIGLVSQDIEFE